MRFLTPKGEKQSYEKWQTSKLTANLSMNFAGTIQCAASPHVSAEQLAEDAEPSVVSLAKVTAGEDSEFVHVTYRALTAALMEDRAVDFSNVPMLKRGTKLLNQQTVFKDHETIVDNWVGRVVKTWWDEETKGIPPGINAEFRLDSVKDPMAVRGVLQGAIHSASVTVSFEWKPSHPDLMDARTFWQHLGEEINGSMVRIVVTKILRFYEISLVWQGADKFAKQIDEDGNPVVSAALACASDASLGDDPVPEGDNMDLLQQLAALLGVSVTAETLDAQFAAHVQAKIAADRAPLETKVAELTEDLTKARTELDTRTAEHKAAVAALEADAALGAKYLEDTRAEAVRLCKLVKGDKVSETILKTLEKSDLEVVAAWKEEFQKEADEKFPARCAKCSGTDITRQSAHIAEAPKTTSAARVLHPDQAKHLQSLHG